MKHKPYGLLQPLPIPERPWSSISMDTIDRLPNSHGFDSILVVVDRFTKMAHFIPTTTSVTSEGIARLFYEHVFSKHGTPTDIVSDRGSTFTSDFFTSLGKILNIRLNFSTPYHPQTDGQTERVNQILEQYLRTYVNYEQNNWTELLPIAEFSYNNAPHSSTQVSPFFANYGYHLNFSASLSDISNFSALQEGTQLRDLTEYLKEQIGIAQDYYKKHADHHRIKAPEFRIGDKVWLSTKNIRTNRPSPKLDVRRIGPFRILERVSPLAYQLDLPRKFSALHPVFHVLVLEPHTENPIPGRTQPPPPPIEIEGELEYEVRRIIRSKFDRHRKKLLYYVEWLGYPDEADFTWETEDDVRNSPELI